MLLSCYEKHKSANPRHTHNLGMSNGKVKSHVVDVKVESHIVYAYYNDVKEGMWKTKDRGLKSLMESSLQV